jgi:hypothetical protein
MPIGFDDRPSPPGRPGAQPIEEVDVNGMKMPVGVFNEVLTVAEKMGMIFRIQQGQGQLTTCGQLCHQIMVAARANDMVTANGLIPLLVAAILEHFRVYKRMDADMTGLPARAGAPEAMRTAAKLLRDHPDMQPLCDLDPAWLEAQATSCEALFKLSEGLRETDTHISSVAGPKSKAAISAVRTVALLAKPQVEASLQLQQRADGMYTYLNLPYKKAQETRRDGERREEQADKRAEERLGAEARTEARAETEAKMLDAVSAALKKEPK